VRVGSRNYILNIFLTQCVLPIKYNKKFKIRNIDKCGTVSTYERPEN